MRKPSDPPHDVIVYGATGFTGGLVAQYLADQSTLDVPRWALAGRDLGKLGAVRERLAAHDPKFSRLALYQASTEDPESLADLAVRTRVVLTTVGPYARHGYPLVAACVRAGTDYVDLTGEPDFWQRIVADHDAAARRSGALIVPCCGFDSIPHDVGAWLVVQALRDQARAHGLPIALDGYVAAKGRPSGGTWHSALGILAHADLPGALAGTPALHFAKDVARWVIPMPTIDPMVVARSATLGDYGPGFVYRAWMETGSRAAAVPILAGAAALWLATKIPLARTGLESLIPTGTGPSAERRAESWFRVQVVGRCGDATATATVSGGDPGYDETAKMIAESALCLATQRAALPLAGGVVTPASAMGALLVARLRAAGLTVTAPRPPA